METYPPVMVGYMFGQSEVERKARPQAAPEPFPAGTVCYYNCPGPTLVEKIIVKIIQALIIGVWAYGWIVYG